MSKVAVKTVTSTRVVKTKIKTTKVVLEMSVEEAQTLYQVLASVQGTNDATEVATNRIRKLRNQLHDKGFEYQMLGFESCQGLLVFNDSMESLIQQGVRRFNQRLVKEG